MSVTILWDMPMDTDRTIASNRLGIVPKNKKDKTCPLVDMTMPPDTNTWVNWTTEKLINKYKDLEIEVERMLGALGTIKKDKKNYSNKSMATITYVNSRK